MIFILSFWLYCVFRFSVMKVFMDLAFTSCFTSGIWFISTGISCMGMGKSSILICVRSPMDPIPAMGSNFLEFSLFLLSFSIMMSCRPLICMYGCIN